MKKGDLLWIGTLLSIIIFLVIPTTHEVFISLTKEHPYLMGFIKVGILAIMGELLALRIVSGFWIKPVGVIWRMIIWGIFGILFALIFPMFAGGIETVIKLGLLPKFKEGTVFSSITTAFFISCGMNIIFAPVMMGVHRITDTYIELCDGKISNLKYINLDAVIEHIDWKGLIAFVYIKTIPLFWIPAHTITFLLPAEYRVLLAAFLSIALGGILAFAKKKDNVLK